MISRRLNLLLGSIIIIVVACVASQDNERPQDMVLIPAGELWMGSDSSEAIDISSAYPQFFTMNSQDIRYLLIHSTLTNSKLLLRNSKHLYRPLGIKLRGNGNLST